MFPPDRLGRLRDLACRFPEMLDALAAAEREILDDEPEAERLVDVIYPPTLFDDAECDARDERDHDDTPRRRHRARSAKLGITSAAK